MAVLVDWDLVRPSSSQVHFDQFFVVAREKTLICEGGMAPYDRPSKGFVGWFEDVETSVFGVALRIEFRKDQIALFVEEKEAIGALDEKGRAVASASVFSLRGLLGLPHEISI